MAQIYRMLIAEDDPASARLIKDILERYNIRTDLAEDGRIALKKIESTRYDLLISDYAMPYMDGLILAQNIRNLSLKVPVLFITAHGEKNVVMKAMSAGIRSFIIKPLTPAKLFAEIFKLLSISEDNLVERRSIPLDVRIDRISSVQILTKIRGIPGKDATSVIFANIEAMFNDGRKPEKITMEISEEFLLEETSLHMLDQLLERLMESYKLKSGDFLFAGGYFSHINPQELQQTKNLSRMGIHKK